MAVFQDCLRDLLTLIPQKAPDLARVLGPGLEDFLILSLNGELGQPELPGWGMQAERLSPTNPILRLAEGLYYIPEDWVPYGDTRHRSSCLRELERFLTAQELNRKPGRPKKEPTTGKQARAKQDVQRSGARREALARKAYQIHKDLEERGRKDWRMVARAVGCEIPSERAEQMRVYAYIQRLIHRGKILVTAHD
jgi:hypothetical protein